MDYFSCCEFACSQCEDCEEDIADDIPTSPIAQFDQAASPVRPKYTDQLRTLSLKWLTYVHQSGEIPRMTPELWTSAT